MRKVDGGELERQALYRKSGELALLLTEQNTLTYSKEFGEDLRIISLGVGHGCGKGAR